MTKSTQLAFIGLGVMGGPIAGHLARAGHRVIGYNRTASRAEVWRDTYANEGLDVAIAATPGEAAEGCSAVLTCLGNDQDVASVVLGKDGVLAAMQDGAVFVDHTTISPAMAHNIAHAPEAHGRIHCLDAPVSGGQAGAENGKLSVMCGGTSLALEEARPLLECNSASIVYIGAAGAGQAAKAVNQVCIAGVLAGLSEGVRLAQAMGVDTDKVLEAIRGGAAQSWQMENRWKTMVADEFDFGFAIDWMRKDLAIALEEAGKHDLDMTITKLVDQFYGDVQAAGGNRLDTSALITRLPHPTQPQ
ncbi:MAG: NAD(P)-dependent oxidoreductase [Pseudomonadota bacterium]